MAKKPQVDQAPPRRSLVVSSVAVAGIVVFLVGMILSAIGFFVPPEPGAAFSGKAAGMSVTTSNVGLALCFFGCVFVGLAAALKPVAGSLFFEVDQRSWIERAPPWLAPLSGLVALGCLAALGFNGAFG